jgi:hypothetical protein
MKISAVSFGPRYAEGFCPAEFMLMQISALGYAVASEASEASRGFEMTGGRGVMPSSRWHQKDSFISWKSTHFIPSLFDRTSSS